MKKNEGVATKSHRSWNELTDQLARTEELLNDREGDLEYENSERIRAEKLVSRLKKLIEDMVYELHEVRKKIKDIEGNFKEALKDEYR